MKTKLLHSLGPLFGLLLFSAALWVIHHELKAHPLHDVLRYVHALPAQRLSLALLFTVISYCVMTGYDTLALKYIQHSLAYSRIALASFIGYAFSNNIGLSMIAGASVRYRLYSAWGLSTLEIGKVVFFCSMTFWLGFLALGGIIFMWVLMEVPASLHLPHVSLRLLGVFFITVVTAYLLWSFFVKKPLVIRGWSLLVPSIRISLAQITIAMLDWILAGSVLYSLLPHLPGVPFYGFLSIYLLAQMAGIVSQIPGGLGVFETLVLLLLSPIAQASEVLGSLIVFRGIYYVLPLVVAATLLGIQEIIKRKKEVQWISQAFGEWVPRIVPRILTITTFIGGAILLFSGATPAIGSRLAWLKEFLPLPVIEFSHFLGSLVGAGLLLLARGLWRRIDAAYFLTVVFLGAGIVISLLKGFDYEEAFILSVMLVALLPCRRYFYRKASLISPRFSPGWIAAIFSVVVLSFWLALFSFKHLEYSHDLWWHFTLYGDAPRALRSLAGAAGIALLFSIVTLLRPAPHEPSYPSAEEVNTVTSIVKASQATYANLALLGDKGFLFSQTMTAFIMYGVEGRSWIAMGDPLGSTAEWPELAWKFREMADEYGGWTVFYEVGADHLSLYLDLGLTLLNLGEEAKVDLNSFSLEGSHRKDMRHTKNKLEKEGYRFEVLSPEAVTPLLPDLKRISDAWLKEKNTGEKRFSLGFFEDSYVKLFPSGLVKKEGQIVAFATLWSGAEKEELSIDLMRYQPDAPHGVMEYLFIELMLWGKQEGYQWFNLGMAPLSGLEDHELAPLWDRVGNFLFHHGEHFYNFQGLRQYKEKFEPEWKPKYLACPGGMALPHIMINLASLISGGLKGVITK
ncbi:MAG: bifunctional lysylphosphatidylglycerol flippase/synthetase MprF [Deltaproteobacteria bacterium]|nr:bifunctional lysylphosphatidylglycerol flippase/synthetase MprF [Deltaproteobacteria bacterium]